MIAKREIILNILEHALTMQQIYRPNEEIENIIKEQIELFKLEFKGGLHET